MGINKIGPLVSVIMPVYNAENFLKEAINSVLNQSYCCLELLIINDGSSDNSQHIINSFNDSRIRKFSQSNQGVAAARNVGLSNMLGEFFCFCDADDVFPSNSIQSRLNVFFENPAIHFVDGRVAEMDVKLHRVQRHYQPSFKGNPFRPMLKLSEQCYLGQTWLIKRNPKTQYVMRSGLTHGEDFLFLLNLARSGGLYSYTTDLILLYRRHNTSAMANLDGLNNGYLFIAREIRKWPEVSVSQFIYFYLKTRKIMFLSYLFDGRSISKALKSLF